MGLPATMLLIINSRAENCKRKSEVFHKGFAVFSLLFSVFRFFRAECIISGLPMQAKIEKAACRRPERKYFFMSYLRCNARHCSNNQNDLCIREDIRVEGATADRKNDTCCDSFTRRAENYSNVVARNTSAQPETDIQCDVCSCSYNKDCKCTAPSVDISGVSACTCKDTQCSTYDSKKGL